MNQPTVVCPQPTHEQVQAQIENLHWNEKQQEIANTWQRQTTEHTQAIQHQEYMVDHLATPLAGVTSVLIAAVTAVILVRRHIAADIQKNRDDNDADVRYADHLISKHEGV